MQAAQPKPTAPAAEWKQGGDAWTLAIRGEWKGQGGDIQLPAPPDGAAQQPVTIDASGLTGWDARFASALWQLLSGLKPPPPKLELGSLPEGLQQILQLSMPKPDAKRAEPKPAPTRLAEIGERTRAWADDARLTLAFIGDTLLSLGRLLRGKTDMRLADLMWQVDQTGPRSVPIVSLVSAMVGLILAYMGAAQLERFGAKAYVADLMTISVVREVAALMTGIILAGRVGAAFAAQIGSMRANDELDALRTLGIDPVDHLVLPRMLALLLVSPLLTAYAAIVGLLVGWGAAVVIYNIGAAEYYSKTLQAMEIQHVLIGLLKGTVYGVLVALAGCRQGLNAGKSAQAVGDATTQAVVKSIIWIVVSASVLTVIFQRLDV